LRKRETEKKDRKEERMTKTKKERVIKILTEKERVIKIQTMKERDDKSKERQTDKESLWTN